MDKPYTIEVLNFDAVPCIFHTSERRLNWRYPVNWHNDIELVYGLEGELDVRMNENLYKMYPGNFYVFNSQVMHNITSDTYGKYMCLILSEEFCKTNRIDVSEYRFRPYIEKDPALSAGFELLEKHFYHFDNERIIGVTKAASDILYRLFTQYAEKTDSESPSHSSSLSRTKTVIAYLNKHFDEHITLELLVSLVNINKYQLVKDFKKETGMTILQYLNLIRCKAAKSMMKDGLSASEAAYSCGFTTPSYFSKVFTKTMGTPPSHYTNRH